MDCSTLFTREPTGGFQIALKLYGLQATEMWKVFQQKINMKFREILFFSVDFRMKVLNFFKLWQLETPSISDKIITCRFLRHPHGDRK